MWDFCLYRTAFSPSRWNAFPLVALYPLSASLSCAHACTTNPEANVICFQLSWTPQIMFKSVDLTKALMNGVLPAFYSRSLSRELNPSQRSILSKERERGNEEAKGQRDKWGRERRGEREIFLFISGCKERTSGEVRGFKGSMFAVQGSEKRPAG